MDMNDRALYYLDALARNSEVPGGLSFRKALAQSNLDYSAESLDRVDHLLDQIRIRFQPKYGEFFEPQPNQNCLFLLCFYVGTVISKCGKRQVQWLDYDGMLKAIPDNGAMFPRSFETAITCIVHGKGFFVPLSSICSRLFDDPTEKSVRFSAEGFM
jgi:hypothetical protein